MRAVTIKSNEIMWCLLFDNEYLLLGNDILSSGENCGSDVGGLVRGKTEGNIAVALPALRNTKLVWWQVFAQMVRGRASENFGPQSLFLAVSGLRQFYTHKDREPTEDKNSPPNNIIF